MKGVGRWALGVGILVAGCGSKAPAPESSKPEEKPPETNPQTSVGVGEGKGTLKDTDTGEAKLDILWKEGSIDPKSKVITGEGISGTLYKNGKPAADYLGKSGGADQSREILILRGDVQVKSKTQDATLYCDELRYEGKIGKDGRIRARGNVRIVSKDGTLNSGSELWATPDLNEVALPELFGKL